MVARAIQGLIKTIFQLKCYCGQPRREATGTTFGMPAGVERTSHCLMSLRVIIPWRRRFSWKQDGLAPRIFVAASVVQLFRNHRHPGGGAL